MLEMQPIALVQGYHDLHISSKCSLYFLLVADHSVALHLVNQAVLLHQLSTALASLPSYMIYLDAILFILLCLSIV